MFCENQPSLPRENMIKHSSLFCCSMSDEDESLIALTPGVNVIKVFSFVADDEAK
jgi:hypothetical protein